MVHVAVGVREVVVERVVVVGRDVYLFDDVDGQVRRYGLVDRVVVRFPGSLTCGCTPYWCTAKTGRRGICCRSS